MPTPKEVLIERSKAAIKKKLWSMIPFEQIIAWGVVITVVILTLSTLMNGCMMRMMRPKSAGPNAIRIDTPYSIVCKGCGTKYQSSDSKDIENCPNCPIDIDEVIEQVEAQVDKPISEIEEEVVPDGISTGPRSSKWSSVRAKFIESHPACAVCDSRVHLNVHHIEPFHERPELELDFANLITLCREHHWTVGHDPDGPWGLAKPNWKSINRNVLQDAQRLRGELQSAP